MHFSVGVSCKASARAKGHLGGAGILWCMRLRSLMQQPWCAPLPSVIVLFSDVIVGVPTVLGTAAAAAWHRQTLCRAHLLERLQPPGQQVRVLLQRRLRRTINPLSAPCAWFAVNGTRGLKLFH